MFVGCPRVVCSDHGTENCLLAATQVAFRSEGNDDLAGARVIVVESHYEHSITI